MENGKWKVESGKWKIEHREPVGLHIISYHRRMVRCHVAFDNWFGVLVWEKRFPQDSTCGSLLSL